MKWYYLATLTWLLEILMFTLIITIPAILYLREFNDWFGSPFRSAFVEVVKQKEKNNE